MEKHRYAGPATVKQSYMNHFSVNCPKCNSLAIVNVDNPWFPSSGTLSCTRCSFSQKSNDLKRYNLIVKRNCDNCGKSFRFNIPGKRNIQYSITLSCPHCNQTRKFEPRNEEVRYRYPGSGPAFDPIFNLPLYYQIDIKGNLLWAFNIGHLMEIKSYVMSKLRERSTFSYTTMCGKITKIHNKLKK